MSKLPAAVENLIQCALDENVLLAGLSKKLYDPLIARALGHEVIWDGQGKDAIDSRTKQLYEYKVGMQDRPIFMLNISGFGSEVGGTRENNRVVEEYFGELAGVVFARFEADKENDRKLKSTMIFLPRDSALDATLAKLAKSKSTQKMRPFAFTLPLLRDLGGYDPRLARRTSSVERAL